MLVMFRDAILLGFCDTWERLLAKQKEVAQLMVNHNESQYEWRTEGFFVFYLSICCVHAVQKVFF